MQGPRRNSQGDDVRKRHVKEKNIGNWKKSVQWVSVLPRTRWLWASEANYPMSVSLSFLMFM